jgi:hypothetical protein
VDNPVRRVEHAAKGVHRLLAMLWTALARKPATPV